MDTQLVCPSVFWDESLTTSISTGEFFNGNLLIILEIELMIEGLESFLMWFSTFSMVYYKCTIGERDQLLICTEVIDF